MTATFLARASRQTTVLAAIAALHAAVIGLVAAGLHPAIRVFGSPETPIHVILPKPRPTPVVAPERPGAVEYSLPAVPMPNQEYPRFDDSADSQRKAPDPFAHQKGSLPSAPGHDLRAPTLRMHDSRLSALIDACYPATARRLGEEGRAIARVAIGADGRPAVWSIAQSSGFPRLDAAMDCVIRRLEFAAGQRDGRAVEAVVMLPIVFRLD